MPFIGITVTMRRTDFVNDVISGTKSLSYWCREYNISRPTGYKWLKRYENGESMEDRSHQTFGTPMNKTDPEIEALILKKREKEPAIGAVKIKRMLENEGVEKVPAHSTVNAILKRNGKITKEESEARKQKIKRFEHANPNDQWQLDFKGDFALGDGRRCYPLSLIDDHSRFCLCADALENEKREGVQSCFERVMKEFGQPKIILCDNGNPWGCQNKTGFSGFELWLMEHGILPIHIRPHRPKTQGKVERFNGSYKRERLKFHIPANMKEAMETRLEYQHFYNYERPHFALNLDFPVQHYLPSTRAFQEEIAAWNYSGEHEVIKIWSTGYMKIAGVKYYVGEIFAGKEIELRETEKNQEIRIVCYREFKIGVLDLKEHDITIKRAYLIQGDPRNESLVING